MANWRVARALDTLLGQLNAMAPRRNKASDGSIGDADHQNRNSDHNPWYGPGIVTARDFTHDPGGGLDCHWLADRLIGTGDGRIKYVIWNRRIWQGGRWTSYGGPNPHTSHLHLSVQPNPSCDDTRPWDLGIEEEDMPDIREFWEDYRVQVLDATGNPIQGYMVSPQEMLAQTNRVAWLLLGKVSELTDDESKILAAVAGVSSGTVDVGVLAEALATSLGPDLGRQVADELSRRVSQS
jgi:hypothetical protein